MCRGCFLFQICIQFCYQLIETDKAQYVPLVFGANRFLLFFLKRILNRNRLISLIFLRLRKIV